MTTLISFLGRSQLGYRPTRYCFPDGDTARESAYFGLVLAERLNARRMVLLGTAGSMWDMLVESLASDDADTELRLTLIDQVRASAVTQELLDRLGPLLTRTVGRPVEPVLIGNADDFDGQQSILTTLFDRIGTGETVAFDLTHGFRHLAMLGLTAGRYLMQQRQVKIAALYYGALDLSRDGLTPVLMLDGLSRLLDWTEALSAYQASGDFSRFAPLLESDGLRPEAARELERGWQALNNTQVLTAAPHVRNLLKALDDIRSGPSLLFRDRLRKALRWANEPQLAEQQRLLALQALKRGDTLRAAIFGLESLITRLVVERGGDPSDYNQREKARDEFKEELSDADNPHPGWKRDAFRLLNSIRNALAHGTQPLHAGHRQLLANPQRLRQELDAALNRLNSLP